MFPLLEVLADGKDYPLRAVTTALADRFGLTDAERAEPLPSGQQPVIANRVAWAKTYLKKAGLIAQPARGVVRITAEGKTVLASKPARIDNSYLRQYPTFADFYGRTAPESEGTEPPADAATPEETLEAAALALRNALADELIDKLKACSPSFFERLVVDLLVAMGYGGSLADAGHAIGRSGDGGIDGIIKEDKLGLDVVCVQAKRWEGTVGSREVRDFVGGMETYRSRKGVLITTSGFSKDAREYVTQIERRVVLIDGRRLAELMIDHGVGVATARTFAVKRSTWTTSTRRRGKVAGYGSAGRNSEPEVASCPNSSPTSSTTTSGSPRTRSAGSARWRSASSGRLGSGTSSNWPSRATGSPGRAGPT